MAGVTRRRPARVVVAQAGERAGSRTEKGGRHPRRRCPGPKVRSRSQPGPAARETEVVTPAKGEQGGEQGLARGVPPLAGSVKRALPRRRTPRARGERIRQVQIVVQVAARRPRAALCAARNDSMASTTRPMAVPWRERPRDLAALAITPAARGVVAHATLSAASA